MMSRARATYWPTLSPLSIGQMLISARSMKYSFRHKGQRYRVRVAIIEYMKKGCRFSVCGRLAALAVAVLPAFAFADEVPTQPASPISRPAPGSITIRRTGKILILPFAAINPTDPQPWIGKSVQQSLVADLLV